METITAAERARRRRIVGSAIGTHEMEGLSPDVVTRQIMNSYAEGELTEEQFSAAMQRHAEQVLESLRSRSLVGAA